LFSHLNFVLHKTFPTFFNSTIFVQISTFLYVISLLVYRHLLFKKFSFYVCISLQFPQRTYLILFLFTQRASSFFCASPYPSQFANSQSKRYYPISFVHIKTIYIQIFPCFILQYKTRNLSALISSILGCPCITLT
jgi:hypothetical protein